MDLNIHNWLKEEIKLLYSQRDNISVHLKTMHSELTYQLHQVEFDIIQQQYREKAEGIGNKQYKILLAKLGKLRQAKATKAPPRKPYNAPEYYPRLINEAEIDLTDSEVNLLNKGLQYAPKQQLNRKGVTTLAIHLDAALEDDNVEGRFELAKSIKDGKDTMSLDVKAMKAEQATIEGLKKKVEDNNLIICKADKGNTVTILDRNNYIEQMEKCIHDMQAQLLPSDPTSRFNRDIIKAVNENKLILNDRERCEVKNPNPSAPILNGYPKIHKKIEEGMPVPFRPISSAFNAPAHKLSKKLSIIIPNEIDYQPVYSVRNSVDFIQRIKNINLPRNSKLISFDVKSLFPSIPSKELLDMLHNEIDHKLQDNRRATQLKRLLTISMNQNYFEFNGKFYKQNQGLAMGSPFSPFGAEFYLNNWENKLFKSSINGIKNVLCWIRYVDDIFCIWTGTTRNLLTFLNDINNIDQNIQFTMEIGQKKLNFLDLTVSIGKENELEFEIYRKPTFTDCVIPATSSHANGTKKAAFHSMIDRLLRVPMKKKAYKKELSNIIGIAENNGYDKKMVFQILKMKEKSMALQSIFPIGKDGEKLHYRSIPYWPELSEKVAKTLRKYNITAAYKNNNTLKTLLVNNKIKTKLPTGEKSGVYQINCGECDAIYIGKTKRKLKVRVQEHLKNAKLSTPSSAFAQHLLDHGHSSTNCTSLLHQ